jgi:Methyltransferase FkbM domain
MMARSSFAYGESGLINSLVANARYIAHSGEKVVSTVTVNCESLDRFCQKNDIPRIDFLKIDVEGAEMSVLRGSNQFLASGEVRFVYLEFTNVLQRDGASGGDFYEPAAFLKEFNYRLIATYTECSGRRTTAGRLPLE